MSEVSTNPTVIALQDEWAKAKDAETQWRNYRLKMEEQILSTMKNLGYDFPEKGTMHLEKVDLKFSLTRSWDQPCLGQVITANPSLLQTTFKVEYKPISNPAIDKFIHESHSKSAVEIAGCFNDKPAKPSFALRKE